MTIPVEQIGAAVPSAVVAGAYWRRARTLAARGTPVPRARVAAFGAGVALSLAAVLPPLGVLDDRLLVAHMAQHLLLIDSGPLLITLGLTGPLLQPVLRVPALAWLRKLTHPVAAFGLWAVNLYVWHTPALYQAAIHSDAVHALQHLLFVGLGVNVWLALIGPLPKPAWFGNLARLGYIVALRLTGTVLANVLLWSGTVFYPAYRAGDHAWHLRPLTDQGIAGALMMLEESLLTIALFAWLFLKTARDVDERQELLELAASRGVDLDERRAARAVAAGRGAELRRRLEAAPEPVAAGQLEPDRA
jgi:putative membrane protein